MRARRGTVALVSVVSLGLSLLGAEDVHACGGCFHLESEPESTVVTGHRMVLSISPTQTVLWDQVRYTGSPSEFAWVLPIKKGATLELASNAWFEGLEAVTATRILAPRVDCAPQNFGSDSSPGFSCCMYATDVSGSYSGINGSVPDIPPPSVTIVNRATVGPYDVVTLSTDVPGALTNWLKNNKFAIDADIAPVIDQYTAEGFDFIAMRLAPNAEVKDMQPVRVKWPGASPVLPLRMVAAGTGAKTAITLFVIGEGRWEAKNFPNATISGNSLAWDFATSSSNYGSVRFEELQKQEGRVWLTTFARTNSLFSHRSVTTGQDFDRQIDIRPVSELYIDAGVANGDADSSACGALPSNWVQYAGSNSLVVDSCGTDPGAGGAGGMAGGGAGGMGGGGAGGMGGGAGGTGEAGSGGAAPCADGQISSDVFSCAGPDGAESFDDLAVALTGMHPYSVWVTRLEASLPRAALQTDFELQPATQSQVENWIKAPKITNPPCTLASAAAPMGPSMDSRRDRYKRTELAMMVLLVFGVVSAFARRASRRKSHSVYA